MRIEEWLGKENQLGIDIWNKKYCYNGETFEEWLDRVSNKNEDLKELIRSKKFLFGGRILANRNLDVLYGKKVTYSNCYVIPPVEDTIESIYKSCSDLARTFSYSGGCGIDISKLRPAGMKVNNAALTTTGAVSFMDTFSLVAETIGAKGRRAALMLSIDCSHPDLEEFISIKNDLSKVTKANISVRISNDFMNAVENNLDWQLYFKTENGDEVVKTVKAKEIYRVLCKNNHGFGEPGILFWDRIKDYGLLSKDPDFEYAGVNPCAEQPLPSGGSCLLGSINLVAYVNNGQFKYDEFIEDIGIIVRSMNEVLDQGLPLHPLQIQKDTVRDYRQMGIGIMGLADMLIKLELKYDSSEAIQFCDNLGFILANEVVKQSALLAKEQGSYPKYNKEAVLQSPFLLNNTTQEVYDLVEQYGLANSAVLTIAPTGTLSTMLGISGGIEPIFSLSYTRKTESLHGEDRYYKVFTPIAEEYMKQHNLKEEEELPNFFVTAQTINPYRRVEMQGTWQNHIDASISSTINLPNSATVEDVEGLYMAAWKNGLKGMTIFRDGCERLAILSTGKPKEEKKEEDEVKELRRGEWKSLAEDTYYVKRKLSIGCGTLKLFIGYSPSENAIQDLYVVKSGSGGCEKNLQAIAITMSAVLRVGGNLEQLEKAYSGISACPSFASARAKGIPLSQGNYCGMAILNEVKKFLKEVNGEEVKQPKVKAQNKEKTNSQQLMGLEKCPECGEKTLMMTGGCMQCSNCSYTKCE